MRKIPRFLARNGNLCNFGLFFLNLVAMATPLVPLKIEIAYLKSKTQKPDFSCKKSPRFLAQNWNQCNFGLFLLKFGCHGNSLASLKNYDSVLRFTSPEIPTVHAKNVSISCREPMSAFLPKFGCHGNSLSSLKNSDRVLKFINPEIPTLYAKNFSISCTREVMSACFAQIWLPWRPPWLPWNFIYHIWIRRPRKLFNYVINSSISCTELKSVQFWLIFA